MPLVIDDVRPPLAFRAAQTVSLQGWPRSKDNTDGLLGGISARLGRPRKTPPEVSREKKKPRWLIATIAGVLAVAAAMLWVVIDKQPPADVPITANHDIIRIAVLPFEDFSINKDNAHIAAGLQEDIISSLAKVEELEVTSRASTQRFSQANERSLSDIARTLSISHVVEGSVRRSEDQIRVSVQLIEASTDRQLWAESYNREMSNIFVVQNDVARDVAEQLEKNFSTRDAEQLTHSPTSDLEAYELVLKGRAFLNERTATSYAQAATLFTQAIERDPGIAEAHAGLSRALFLQSFLNTSWSEVRTQALQASEIALKLDPESASVHTNYAHIRGVWEGELEIAGNHYRKAIELEPNNSFSLLHYGAHLDSSGEAEEGIRLLRRAMTLNPLSGETSFYLAKALANSGSMNEAIKTVEQGLKLNPKDFDLLGLGVFGSVATGDLAAAFAQLHELAVIDPQHLQNQGVIVLFLSTIGALDAAQLWVDRMHAMSPNHAEYFDSQLLVYSIQGDIEGLTQLLAIWQTLNTNDRASRDLSSTIQFATQCQQDILAIRADNARRNNDKETEQVMRRSAVEIAEEFVTDDQGNIVINYDNQRIALSYAIHQRLLGNGPQSLEILTAIVQSANYSDLYEMLTISTAHALLGPSPSTLEFLQSRSGQFNNQTGLQAIRENPFGLYDSLLANPEIVQLLDSQIAANSELQAYLHTELPSLLTATTGL